MLRANLEKKEETGYTDFYYKILGYSGAEWDGGTSARVLQMVGYSDIGFEGSRRTEGETDQFGLGYVRQNVGVLDVQIHSFCSLSYDRSVASSRASSPQGAI